MNVRFSLPLVPKASPLIPSHCRISPIARDWPRGASRGTIGLGEVSGSAPVDTQNPHGAGMAEYRHHRLTGEGDDAETGSAERNNGCDGTAGHVMAGAQGSGGNDAGVSSDSPD